MVESAIAFWVILFASSTILTMGLYVRRMWVNYNIKRKEKEKEIAENMERQQEIIEKWKRKVLRP
ncbi:MAG: hypothetical protein M3162_04875 [Thermoproteota archaeon]|nr:hypothetical protein [Thermoproteota archaeon]